MSKVREDNSNSGNGNSHSNGNGLVRPYSVSHGTIESEHFVQFYENDNFLINSLGDFIGKGLDSGDSCVVVATEEHREALDGFLQNAGHDTIQAQKSGQYNLLDAFETYSEFMVDGFPDARRFDEVIGSIVKTASASGRRVRIFGEMVALLVAANNSKAAVEVERLWNELNKNQPFILFCAYPLGYFSNNRLSESFQNICQKHTHVIPTENYITLDEAEKQLLAVSLLQHKAACLEAEIIDRKNAEENLRAVKDELEIQLDDMRRLHQLSKSFAGILDLDFLLGQILEAALDVQKTDLGVLSLFESESGGLVNKTQRGFDEKLLENVGIIPPGKGACGVCYQERRQIIVEDVYTDPIFEEYREAAQTAGYLACHSTPLIARNGNIIGVLTVHFREARRPSERAVRLMDLYARMAADSIENAQLHQKVRQELEEREKLLIREQLARAEAENANHLKDEFLATVSHELRTPLNAIIGWSSMLLKDGLDSETKMRAVDTIARNAHSQARLIEDLLDVSRVISGKLRLNIAPVDISSVIHSAVDAVHLAADSKDIRLEVIIEPSVCYVMGDANRLQQVVWNLLSNAIKFTPSGGQVKINLKKSVTDLEIEVGDTGQGINPEFLPFIFDRFRQGDGTSTRRHNGLGLGLAIVKHLVELHGGIVYADSAGENRGTTFTIKLPVAAHKKSESPAKITQNEKAVESDNSIGKPYPALAGVKILLVDDNLDTLQMLEVLLSEYKLVVQTAESVEDAMDVLDWFKPQILVSDLAMPERDGFSLIKKIRSLEDAAKMNIPAIALTAYVRAEDRARALSAGFNSFVPKPVELEELLSAINNLVSIPTIH